MQTITFDLEINIATGKIFVRTDAPVTVTGYDSNLRLTDPLGHVIFNRLDESTPDVTEASPDLELCAVPLDSNGNALVGEYILDTVSVIEDKGYTVNESGSEIYTYCNNVPAPDLVITSSCATAQVTVKDATQTGISCNGSTITPLAYQYTLVTQYPNTMVTPIANVTTTDSDTLIGPNIWSGEYTSTITITYTYQVDTYLQVIGSATKIETHDVVCSTCVCTMNSCIQTVIARLAELRGNAPREAEVLEQKLQKLVSYYMVYDIAVTCGNADIQSEYCALMKDLISSSLSCCNQASNVDETSVEITPVSTPTGGSSTPGSKIWVGSYATVGALSGVGVDTDIAIDSSGTGRLYQKTGGVWVFQVSLNGAAGAAGSQILIGAYPNVGALGSSGSDGDMAVDTSGTGNFYSNTSGTWSLEGSMLGPEGGTIIYANKAQSGATLTLGELKAGNFDNDKDTVSVIYMGTALDDFDFRIGSTRIFEINDISSTVATSIYIESEIVKFSTTAYVVSKLSTTSGETLTTYISYDEIAYSSVTAITVNSSTTCTATLYTLKNFKL